MSALPILFRMSPTYNAGPSIQIFLNTHSQAFKIKTNQAPLPVLELPERKSYPLLLHPCPKFGFVPMNSLVSMVYLPPKQSVSVVLKRTQIVPCLVVEVSSTPMTEPSLLVGEQFVAETNVLFQVYSPTFIEPAYC